MKTDPATKLVKRVRRYLKQTGMSQTNFGKAVCNNQMLYWRLESGNVTLGTVRKVITYLDAAEKQ
jgi:predicted transcriptional regulator